MGSCNYCAEVQAVLKSWLSQVRSFKSRGLQFVNAAAVGDKVKASLEIVNWARDQN